MKETWPHLEYDDIANATAKQVISKCTNKACQVSNFNMVHQATYNFPNDFSSLLHCFEVLKTK